MVKQIPLKNKNKEIVEYTTVDDEDYDELSKLSFHLFISDNKKYAICSKPKGRLHHLILKKNEDKNITIDHIDGNGLNNTKDNLRYCTISQNAQNRNNDKTTDICKYIGVKPTRYNKFQGYINNNSKRIHLGNFDNTLDAAKQYDIAAFLIYGENAKTNGLIKYSTIKRQKLTLEDILPKKVERDLPLNIKFVDNKYQASRTYNKKRYLTLRKETLEEAIIELENLNKELEELKLTEQEKFENQEIKRNDDGIAIISVKNKDKTVYALVDDELWLDLNKYNWSISGGKYVNSCINGKSKRMHHYITGEDGKTMKSNEVINFINNNTLDNRKVNLKKQTRSQSAQNTIMKNDETVGVSFNKTSYKMSISHDKKNYAIQGFEIKELALIAYNIMSKLFEYQKFNQVNKEDYNKYKNEVYEKLVVKKTWLSIEKFEEVFNELI